MKQNYFKLIVLTAFLLFANAGAQAQALIHWNAIGRQTTNPIIREWTPGGAIGYMEDLSRGGYFFIKDINPIAQVAVLPVGNTVTDFRVKNDSVFFCGMDNTYGYGIVGFFDINALFAGTGTITYGILQQTVSSPYVTRPTRMDVYTFRGITHIAFVGDLLTNVPGSPTLVPSTTVGDAYFDNYFSTWNIDFYQNAGCDTIYTDIAASSDYVVAVAKKNFSPDYFVHVFRISGDFLSSPIGANNVFQITDNVPMGDILLEDISATDFVLAYHFAVAGGPGTELQQFRVDPVTPTIIIQLSLLAHHGASVSYSPAWAMKQLSFDATGMRLLLLQDAATDMMPSVESNILSFTPSGIGSGYVDVSFIPGVSLNRMDAKSTGGYWAIGDSGGVTAIAEEFFPAAPSMSCQIRYTLDCGTIPEARVTNRYPDQHVLLSNSLNYMNVSQKFVEFYMYCTER